MLQGLIDQAADIDAIEPQVAFAGGEPTLYWDDLLTLIKFAADLGLRPLVISNGWWGREEADARQRLEALVAHGLHRLELSISPFHRRFVPHSSVETIRGLSAPLPVATKLQVRYSRSEQDALLDELGAPRVGETRDLAPILKVGRAPQAIPEDEFFGARELPRGACFDDLSLVVTPHGDVYPCCCGSELTESLRLGNVEQRSLSDLVEEAQRWALLRRLVRGGPTPLVESMDDATRQALEGRSYESICELCVSVFSCRNRAEKAEAIVTRWAADSVSPSAAAGRVKTASTAWVSALAEPLGVESIDPKIVQPQPSGAVIVPLGAQTAKVARPPFSDKLRAQVAWFAAARRHGLAGVPEVKSTIEDDDGVFGYVMPTYDQKTPAAYSDRLRQAEAILDRLEPIWQVPQPYAVPRQASTWQGYATYLRRLMAPYEPALGKRVEALAGWLEAQRPLAARGADSVMVHGDPTFENLVFDADGGLVLLDPNPQPAASLAIPELDVAKVMQSLCSWEAFVDGTVRDLSWDTSLRPRVEKLFGPVGWVSCAWLLVGHLIRTLPYGAKVGDATRLLPTLHDFVGRLEGEALGGG